MLIYTISILLPAEVFLSPSFAIAWPSPSLQFTDNFKYQIMILALFIILALNTYPVKNKRFTFNPNLSLLNEADKNPLGHWPAVQMFGWFNFFFFR